MRAKKQEKALLRILKIPVGNCSFWGEEGKGKVLVGEVSMCNDDTNDNRFWEPTGRFPEIEEDVPAEFILANEL